MVDQGVGLAVRIGQQDCPSPHSFRNKCCRVLWGIIWLLLFRPSPRVFHGWRRTLLRLFGASISHTAKIDPTVRIWIPRNLEMGEEATLGGGVNCYCVERISLGAHATVSQESYLCTATHDAEDPFMRLVAKPIRIEDQAWVCARSFIMPGITVHQGGVVGACAVVTKNVAAWEIVAGNPARFVRTRVLRKGTS